MEESHMSRVRRGDLKDPRVIVMTWETQPQETRSPDSLFTGITYEGTSSTWPCKVRLVLVALALDVREHSYWETSLSSAQ